MQKTKKIHHKSNTTHGKKRKVRTIKHPKKNIRGGSYLDESAKITEQNQANQANQANQESENNTTSTSSWRNMFSGSNKHPFTNLNFNSQPTVNNPPAKITEQNQANQESENNTTSTSSWRNMFSGSNKHPFTNLNFNSQPTVNNPPADIVPEGIVRDRVENYAFNNNNNKTTNRPESVGSDLTTNSLRGSTQDVLAANRLSEGPGGGPVGEKRFFPGQLKRENAFRGNIGENDDVAEPDPNATGNVVEASGQGAESLLTTNSEGDLRSPEEFAQGSRPPLGVSDPLPMLPPGFRTTVDEQSGRLIYHNDNNSTASWDPPTVDNIVPELGTIYIVRYRNSNGAISEKEVFKHIDTNPGNYTRYIFDDNNIPRECNLGIYDIGVEIKKKYEPKCEEISLEPLGKVR